MNVTEAIQYSAITATPGSTSSPPSPFKLKGGRYSILATTTGWGGASCSLQLQSIDSSRWVTVKDKWGNPVTFSADGQTIADLPAGLYQVMIAGGPPAPGINFVAASVPI